MNWQNFEDIDPNYSGYAWVKAIAHFDSKEWVYMCRIWTEGGSWTGWDLSLNESLGLNKFFNTYQVMLLEEPQ